MKTGMELAICRKTARRIRRLQNQHALATTRQVGCANQSIMAGANND